MGARPRNAAFLSGFALAVGVVLIPSTHAAPPNALAGVVHDALGRAIAGVEVLVLPDRSADAVGSAVTDGAGRFRVPDLPGGLYRVAALKPGYLASVTRANTVLRATVDVVLHPVPRPGEPGSEIVTPRPSWVLRAPVRSILRETEMREIVREATASEKPARDATASLVSGAPSMEVVEGQFRHIVALGSNSAESGSRSGPFVGGETSMQLTSALGQRGSLRFVGRRENLETSRTEFDGTAAGSRSTEALAFDLSYDTSRDASLDVSAYFAQGAVSLGSAPADSSDAGRESRRTWGYDATWTKQLDEASRLAVSLGYRDALLDVPGEYLRSLGMVLDRDSRSLSNRAIGATGTYEIAAGDDHLVRVGARAQLLNLAIPLVRDGSEAMFVELPGGAGWSVRIDAEDAWSVSPPLTLVYGLGVQQVLDGAAATLIVPHTGAEWSPGRVRLKMLLSYYAAAGSSDPGGAAGLDGYDANPLLPERPLGWETEFVMPVSGGVTLRAAHSYEPLRDATRTAAGRGAAGDSALLPGGGRASDARSSIALTREAARASTSIAWTWGVATGLIGQEVGFDLPVQILAERTLGYRAGRVDVRFPEAGTDLALEYRRFEETASPESPTPLVNSYFELAMGQQVAHLTRLGATCRLLLAARLSPPRGIRDGDSMQVARARTIAALNQRVSAGLLVAF